jgi:hypothetical protein
MMNKKDSINSQSIFIDIPRTSFFFCQRKKFLIKKMLILFEKFIFLNNLIENKDKIYLFKIKLKFLIYLLNN